MSINGRRLGFWLLLCLGLLLQGRACAEIRAPFYEAVRGNQIVYVLGTLHVGREDFYPLRQPIESSLQASAQLFLEIDQEDSDVQKRLAEVMLCDRPCLKEALSESEWHTLAERLGQQEAALRSLEKMRPWAAAIVLTMADFTVLGLSPEQAVEEHLSGMAGKEKPVIGLETAEEQIRLFTEMPPAEQKEMLTEWLNMTVKERLDTSRELVAHWKDGDADALHAWHEKVERQYNSSPEVAAAFDQRFLTARNRILVERLLLRIGSAPGPFFLGIGALHLGGPDGVLALLKSQGFKVRAK
jgi:uncharacterized protein YbaP (TraB family)